MSRPEESLLEMERLRRRHETEMRIASENAIEFIMYSFLNFVHMKQVRTTAEELPSFAANR